MIKPKTEGKMIFHQKICSFLKCFWNMLSKKGEKQDKFIIYLLLIEVFVIILIVGIAKIDAEVKTNLAVALGTISMALAIVYIEIIKPWLQKPKIKIEYKNEDPFCRKCDFRVENNIGCLIRLRIRNIGGSVAKNLRGKLVDVINKDGKTYKYFDPLFLHWASTPIIEKVDIGKYAKWLDPIDLNAGEWEFLDVFITKTPKKKQKESDTDYLERKEKEKGLLYINTKTEARGCVMILKISEGLKAFKITIYGNNIEPVTETYKLKWNGENYNEIEMDPINQKKANNG